MKNVKFLLVGVFFGLALTKGEAISWYRIQEMFHFESFHMFGIFMTAVPVGTVSILIIRKMKFTTIGGEQIDIPTRKFTPGMIIGGLIFGFGWALTGACPGPLYAQTGAGYLVTIVTFLSAVAGTWVFGKLQKRLGLLGIL